MKINKWAIKGKVNLKKANDYVIKHSGYKDGQYIYANGSICFGDADRATLYKTLGAARGMLTKIKSSQEDYGHSTYVEDLEIIDVKVIM